MDVFAWCKQHKDELLAAREAGDVTAKTIITAHDLYVRFPEHIALGLLEKAVEEWQQREIEANLPYNEFNARCAGYPGAFS
jgi:hypothetical protein